MDREFKTTFIPKKSLSQENPGVTKSRKSNTLIGFVAFLLLITAIVSAVGVYVYKIRVATVMNSRNESIKKAGKAFEPAAILELKKLDIRLRAATELLDQHVALSDFFDSFGESTLPGVSFDGLQFVFQEEQPEVNMTGTAKSYLTVAQQSDLYEKNRFINNHIFSNFSIDEDDQVAFSLSFTLDDNLLKFGRTVVESQDSQEVDASIILPGSTGVSNQGTEVNFGA